MNHPGYPATNPNDWRGGPIVWSAKEWDRRWKRSILIGRVLPVGSILAIGYIIISIIAIAGSTEGGWLLICGVFWLMVVLDICYVLYAFPAARHTPGLYANGVQLTEGGFVPWYTIGNVQRMVGLAGRERVLIMLLPQYGSSLGLVMTYLSWSLPLELVGEEGLKAMGNLAGSPPPGPPPTPPSPPTPPTPSMPATRVPELRVYGPGGARYGQAGPFAPQERHRPGRPPPK
jgi:hypothetical protein